MKTLTVLLCLLATSALAAPENPLGSAHNSKLPIAIAANSLEVLQNEDKAVFTGAVVATQGDMTLKSDQMVVYYHHSDDKQKSAAAPNAPKTGEQQNNVSKIDVIGNVFITSPQETAKGDKGTYDVDQKMIHLTGDVVLTKDKNVLRGSSAEYNVETGHSLMKGGADVTAGGKPGTTGRVRGLFVPDQDAKKKQ